MNTQINLKAEGKLQAKVTLPASKSISNRALVISALSGRQETPENVSDCDDTRVMVRALSNMPYEIDIMAAGTAMRFLSALLSVTPGTHIITGTERMRHRPIGILVDALRQLGAQVEYVNEEGFPPLRITGNEGLTESKVSLSGSVSSQYISALLMIGPVLKNGLELKLTGNIVSRPYIEMTLTIMRQFGAKVEWQGADTIKVEPVPYTPVPYLIENDWSAASYWYEMVALSNDKDAEVILPGLFKESTQGDAAIQRIFAQLGVKTEFTEQGVRIYKGGDITERLDYNFVNEPDMAQTFVVTCAMMGIPFRFTGLQSLKIKETDRILALRTELRKLGYEIGEAEDSILFWDGERCEAQPDPAIDTYEDHRMAMSFAPCALKLGSIRINDPHVVSKSYPTYWESLVGVKIEN